MNDEQRSTPILDAMQAIASSDKGKMDFRGRKYTPVAVRVERLREAYGDQCAIYTDLVQRDESTVVMRAEVWAIVNNDWVKLATGYAEEVRSNKGVNSTSALENAETSAVGRALAALGLGGGEYASADELTGALSRQAEIDESKIADVHAQIKDAYKEDDHEACRKAWGLLSVDEKSYLWRELDNPRKGFLRKAQNEERGAGDDASAMKQEVA